MRIDTANPPQCSRVDGPPREVENDEKAWAAFLQHRKGKRNLAKGRSQRFGKRWGSGERLTGFRRGGRSGKGAGKSRPGSWLKGKSGFGKSGKGDGKSKATGSGHKRIPDEEFKKMRQLDARNPKDPKRPKCRWWNSSVGCDRSDATCPYAHGMCLLCGSNHRWCEKHL